MTTESWIAARSPRPPAELTVAMTAAISQNASDETSPHETLVAASRAVLARVLAGECETRGGALDLLTFDALVTYALEAGADSAAGCESVAAGILAVLADAAAAA